MADTAALVVALSAQLTKFEKDMKDAVTIADRQTKAIENSFSKLNQSINTELSGLTSGLASRLGGIGSILGAIGPVGLTIAAGIGAATIAIGFLNEKVDKFVEKQRAMREAAEVTGLTLDQLKAVGQAATRTGVDFEKAERGIIRMAIAIDDLRSKGTGPLVDSLNKLNPELVTQLINADSSAEAFDILAKALSQMESDFAKVGFAADLFGKRNVEVLRVLRDIVQQGGLVKAALDLSAQGKGINEDLNKRLFDLDNQIKALNKSADNLFGEVFAANQKQAQEEFAQLKVVVASALKDATTNMRSFVDAILAYIATKPGIESTNKELENLRVPGLTTPPRGPSQIPLVAPEAPPVEFPVTTRLPTARPTVEIEALRQTNEELDKMDKELLQNITFMERWAGVLGDAISPAEKYQLELNKINKATLEYSEDSKQSTAIQEAGNRALERLTQTQQIQANQVRERLLLLSEEQIVQNKLAQARLDAEKAGIRNIDLTKAEIVFRKQAKEAIEGQAAALSKLPESVRFAQEAMDQFKQLDKFLVTTAGNFENTFADIAVGTKSLSDAFKSLADSIIRDLVRITIRMAVTGPLLRSLGGLFSGAPAQGSSNIFESVFPNFGGARQGGGSVSRGRGYIVGEHGTELFVPSSAGQIVPGQLTKGGGGGSVVEINNYVAADTESRQTQQSDPGGGERIIIDIVKKAQARGAFDDSSRGRFALRPQKVR